jgi:hypothetical protein
MAARYHPSSDLTNHDGSYGQDKLIPGKCGPPRLSRLFRIQMCQPGARRRRFTAEYRMAVLREADACKQPGEVGALLRREGLYSSHLSEWRKQRD